MTAGTYSVALSEESALHVRTIDAWWEGNRTGTAGLFREELAALVSRLCHFPYLGAPYTDAGIEGMRRIGLPRSRYHVYYVVNEPERGIQVHAVWHMSRGQSPFLP